MNGKITNSISIGYGSRIAGSNEIQLGGFGQTLYAPTAVNIRSDARDKTDIAPLDIGLDFVKKLRPVTGVYDHRDAYTDELFTDLPPEERAENCGSGGRIQPKTAATKKTASSIGFIAQDVAALEAEYGKLPMVNCRMDTYTIEYETFVPVLTKAIQEMSAQIDDLKSRLRS